MIIDISRHCIETASKKIYNCIINQYFNAETTDIEKKSIEKQIDALVYFLENTDFSELRNQYRQAGSLSTISILVIPKNLENMHIKVDNTVFYPVWKQPQKS